MTNFNTTNTTCEPVVAYMRYSSNNQDEKSIEHQRFTIGLYAIQYNLAVVEEYIDEAKTGTNDRRRGFQKLMTDARSRPCWKKILIHDMSRFSRHTVDSGKYFEELEDLDIELISVTERFNSSTEGRMALGLTNLMN
jgi:DNA invertase Pin-like site-specific DNA recombinase